jgi:hypothetical protein
MKTVSRNFNIPIDLDVEIEEHKPKMKITHRYIFFLTLGIKLFTHKTLFERNSKLIENIVNKCEETLHDMELGIQTGRFFKDITTQRLDHIQYMIRMESERRKKQLSQRERY